MLFQTLEFFVLLAAVMPLNLVLRGKARLGFLLLTSYVFYGWFSIPLCGLMVFSTLLDFTAARGMTATDDERVRKRWLIASLAGNLGMLFVFKYTNFFLETVGGLSQLLSGTDPFPRYDIILPLGISFYTFQTLSYSIDVYRRRIDRPSDLLTFATYVAFFPQLVAGPIVRAKSLLPQLRDGPTFSESNVLRGIALVGFGLAKKVVIADNLAPMVNAVFSAPHAHSPLAVLVGIYAFAFQIYCDFSGYSDTARGLGFMMGYDLGDNFRQPYFATGIRDFWRRWHISLSTWLRDYLYIPLGGSRGSGLFTIRNVMITMLLGGLWHGAAWTFVIWGAIHGIWIAIERVATGNRKDAPERSPLARLALQFLTFQGVCVTWVFFRATDFGNAADVFAALFRGGDTIVPLAMWPLVAIPSILLVDAFVQHESVCARVRARPFLFWLTVIVTQALIIAFGVTTATDFVYFQF